MREYPLSMFYDFKRPTIREMYNMRKNNMDSIKLRFVSIGDPLHAPVVTKHGDISTPNMAVIYSLN